MSLDMNRGNEKKLSNTPRINNKTPSPRLGVSNKLTSLKIKNSMLNDERDIPEKIIDCIKEISNVNKNESDNRLRYDDLNLRELDKEKYLAYLLLQLPDFSKFSKFNYIDQETLIIASKFIKQLSIPKNCYIFRQGDRSDKFYGIIKGVVSMRVSKNQTKKDICFSKTGRRSTIFNITINDNHYDFSNNKDEEIKKIYPGMCFGEWGLIYNKERSASAVALQDTELFYLTKEAFHLTFEKPLTKSEYEKKKFILTIMPFLKEIPSYKFEDIYKRFLYKFFKNGEKVIEENSPLDYIYILYRGECRIEKSIKTVFPSKNSKYTDIKTYTILKITKGEIIGIESLLNESKISLYDYSIISSSDDTIVFYINPSDLTEFKDMISKNLGSIQKIKESLIENQLENNIDLNEKMRIKYKKGYFLENNSSERWKIEAEEKFLAEIEKVKKSCSTLFRERSSQNMLNCNIKIIAKYPNKDDMSLENNFILNKRSGSSNNKNKNNILKKEKELFENTHLYKRRSCFLITSNKISLSSAFNNSSNPRLSKIKKVARKNASELNLNSKIIKIEDIIDNSIKVTDYENMLIEERKKDNKEDQNKEIPLLNNNLSKNLKEWKNIKDKGLSFNSGKFNMPIFSLNTKLLI